LDTISSIANIASNVSCENHANAIPPWWTEAAFTRLSGGDSFEISSQFDQETETHNMTLNHAILISLEFTGQFEFKFLISLFISCKMQMESADMVDTGPAKNHQALSIRILL
jgi:hypothetical protein